MKFYWTKLSKYGKWGIVLEWFWSYLTDRNKFVSLIGQNSRLCSIKSGVPEGSILGPLLFLIFINDFPKCTNFFKFTLFADDSTLTCSLNSMTVDNITSSINQNLEAVNHWLYVNKINVNTHKSYHIVFSYRKKLLLPPIRLRREIIAQTEKNKFLGITLDINLSFKAHINETCNKLSRSVGILYKLKSFFQEEILKSLYYKVIHPYINYNIESWFGAEYYK